MQSFSICKEAYTVELMMHPEVIQNNNNISVSVESAL